MNSIEIEVKIDRSKALLQGLVLKEWERVAVSKSTVGDELWPYLVRGLDMAVDPPRLSLPLARCGGLSRMAPEPLPDAGLAALKEMLRKAPALEREEEQKAAERERKAAEAAEKRIMKNDSVLDAYETMELVEVVHEVGGEEYVTKVPPSIPGDWSESDATPEQKERMQRRKAEFLEEAKEHNDVVTPLLEAARLRAKEKADAEAKAEREAIFARRLETGYYEEETSEYDARRYGAPWIATVSFAEGKTSPIYDFSAGDSSGKFGSEGVRRVPCRPGDLFAKGQKNLRRPADSENSIYHMREDGSVRQVDKAEAFRIWEERSKA